MNVVHSACVQKTYVLLLTRTLKAAYKYSRRPPSGLFSLKVPRLFPLAGQMDDHQRPSTTKHEDILWQSYKEAKQGLRRLRSASKSSATGRFVGNPLWLQQNMRSVNVSRAVRPIAYVFNRKTRLMVIVIHMCVRWVARVRCGDVGNLIVLYW
jgi:hypothetical protein